MKVDYVKDPLLNTVSPTWIPHQGVFRSNPFSDEVYLWVRFKDGTSAKGPSDAFCWENTFGDKDVIAYREINS